MEPNDPAPPPKKAKAKSKAAKAATATPAKPKPAKGMTLRCGAVSAYTPELGAEIARRIAEGMSFRTIAKDKGMPGLRTLVDWQNNHPQFALMLDRARELRADRRVEQISDYCKQVVDGTLDPNRGKVAIDGLKWLASRENWMRYGDKQATVAVNIPSPAQPAGPSPAQEDLLEKINRLAANVTRGKTAEQIAAMENATVAAAVEAEILPPVTERPEITKVSNPEPWEPAMDESKLVDVTPRPFEARGEPPARGRRSMTQAEREGLRDPDPGLLKSGCTTTRPAELDRDRYAYPHVIANDFSRWRRWAIGVARAAQRS